MFDNVGNTILVVIVSTVILICSVGIIIASVFQNKSKRKYKKVIDIINNKKNVKFEIKDYLTKEEINEIDPTVNLDVLLAELYDIYLNFSNKEKKLDNNLDDILTGDLKTFYENKIKNYKQNGYTDVVDGIELLNYEITDFNKEDLKFRVKINCFNYKMINNKIVSGSNLEKVTTILLITYKKINGKWLISSYEKLYEKKLSD